MAKRLSFYDVKAKKKFNSQSYKLRTITIEKTGAKRKQAVTESPFTGNKVTRFVPSDFK